MSASGWELAGFFALAAITITGFVDVIQTWLRREYPLAYKDEPPPPRRWWQCPDPIPEHPTLLQRLWWGIKPGDEGKPRR